MTDTGPLRIHTDVARPEWIDYNGHLNDGFYVVAFTFATDAVQDLVGLDAGYRADTGCTLYTVEAHVKYLREVKEGARLEFETWILGVDEKRIHMFHNMHNADGGYLAATHELMLLHVDQSIGKTAVMPDDILENLTGLRNEHARLQRPEHAGSRIRVIG